MLTVRRLEPREWAVLRDLRLRSLDDSPQWFAATLSAEETLEEAAWRTLLEQGDWCTVAVDGQAVGIVGLEKVEPDRGADCWIHGWWIDPRFRGQGIPRLMLDWIDDVARSRIWRTLGLGVWTDNADARAVFTRLGFTTDGQARESARMPTKSYVAMYRDVP
jgi:RimJ/RimL family protein N-acetyltransferase